MHVYIYIYIYIYIYKVCLRCVLWKSLLFNIYVLSKGLLYKSTRPGSFCEIFLHEEQIQEDFSNLCCHQWAHVPLSRAVLEHSSPGHWRTQMSSQAQAAHCLAKQRKHTEWVILHRILENTANKSYGQKTLTDVSPKKTYRWLANIWKDAQHCSLLEKCKSKLQ